MRVFSIPMTTRFRGITVREGVLLEGQGGWVEWSPFTEYSPSVAEPWLRCAEEAAAGDWPEPVRDRVPVNATVPVVSPEEAHALVIRSGCTTAKVKVADPGAPLAGDLARVEAVRDALGPAGKVRVDANGAWSVDEAVRRLSRSTARPAAWSTSSSRAPASRTWPPYAVGSTSRSPPTSRSAGPRIPIACATSRPRTSRCLRSSRSAGCGPVCGSPRTSGCRSSCRPRLETSLGLAAGVALAAALPDLDHACGLATRWLLTADVASPELVPVNGELVVGVPDPRAAARRRRGSARSGGVVGGAAGGRAGRAGGWAIVSDSTALARAVVGQLVERGIREIVLAPGSGTHRWRSRRTTRPRRGWSGCTRASTSDRQDSWRWG